MATTSVNARSPSILRTVLTHDTNNDPLTQIGANILLFYHYFFSFVIVAEPAQPFFSLCVSLHFVLQRAAGLLVLLAK